MTKILNLSPTQLEVYLGCNRAWGLERIEGLAVEITPKQKEILRFGTQMHGLIEDFFRHLKPIPHTTPEGAAALAGLQHWPSPGKGVIAEGPFSYYPTQDRAFVWRGVQDLLYQDAVEKVLVIHDHKSTSDHVWAKTPEDLLLDPQAVVYSHRFFLMGASKVKLKWVYHRRSKPKALPVSLLVSPTDMLPGLARCLQASYEIRDIYNRRIRGNVLPRAYDQARGEHCLKFKGCGQLAHCLKGEEIFDVFYQSSVKVLTERNTKKEKS